MTERQNQLLEMYKAIRAVLDSEKIRFYAVYGTAIGTVRDGGIVPWDDDIDLGIFEEDMPRVIEILRKKLDSNVYYVHTPRSDTHNHVFTKTKNFEEDLANKEAAFIDLFQIERFPSKSFRTIISKINIWLYMRSMSIVYLLNNKIGQVLVRWIPKAIKRFNKIFIDKNSDMTVIYEQDYYATYQPKETYGTPIMYNFEDTDIPVPEQYDKFLSAIYGDYMTPPPEDKRTGAGGYPFRAYYDYIRDCKDQ